MPPLNEETPAAPLAGAPPEASTAGQQVDKTTLVELADRRAILVDLANAIVACHCGGLITADAVTRGALMLCYAIVYAVNGWEVFPLRGKVPAIATRSGGHGVLDATTDIATICSWWAGDYIGANIGGRLPGGVFVLDVDPRDDGQVRLTELVAEHGPLPTTLVTVTGSYGLHYFFRRPPGVKLKASVLGPKTGLDVKDCRGYVVLPPSIHPDTGRRYIGFDADIAESPAWLVDLIVVPEPVARPERSAAEKFLAGAGRTVRFGESPADAFTDSTSWRDVLEPHGWVCLDGDPDDSDGARWLHPTHTSPCSATIRFGCLFVYSTNTAFEVTTPGDPHGYTRFAAYAVLNFHGDQSAAASSLMRGAA